MTGISPFTTFSAMNLHFNKSPYDGWKYGFKTRVNKDKFDADKALTFQFTAIERDYPTINEQLMYFYPAFNEFKYINVKNIRVIRTHYLSFKKRIDNLEETFSTELTKAVKNMKNVLDILDNSGTMPTIFNLYDSKQLSYDSIIILFLIIPELNNIVSKEPFLFDSWKSKIHFDMKFYSLFIAPSQLKVFKKLTINIFKNI